MRAQYLAGHAQGPCVEGQRDMRHAGVASCFDRIVNLYVSHGPAVAGGAVMR